MKRQPYTVLDLCPEPMRSRLRVQGQLGLFLARAYLESSDEMREHFVAFFEARDPEKVCAAWREITSQKEGS